MTMDGGRRSERMRRGCRRAASRAGERTAWLLALAVAVAGAGAPIAAQEWGEEAPCAGALDHPDALPELLAAVPKYGNTYVLVYRDRLRQIFQDLVPAELAELRIAAYDGSPAAAIAEGALFRPVDLLPFDPQQATRLVADVLSGELDAALLWAPLAGLLVQELDFDYQLSLRTVGLPSPPPAALQAAVTAADVPPCADAIRGFLEGYGVLPAEKLVPIDIRDLLHLEAPPRDLEAARAGAALYAQHCARCHGPEAVASTDALAPVDLLVSLPRFSYPGFLYIVLNGRSQNGMPGFRGSLERQQIDAIYQYVRERAHGTLHAGGAGRRP